jgi:microcystin-dependent protein
MPTEVQIFKDGTIIPADLSTGGPSWDTSGNVSISVSGGKFKGPLEGNVTGNVTGNATTAATASNLTGTPDITVGTVTATSFKTSTTSTGFLKADGTVDTNTYITQAVPVGSVFHFAASTAPTGYLKANGDPIPDGYGTVQGITTNFSALYEILGNTYGLYGDGEQVFRLLPDLRGQFIRSWADDGTTYDAGRAFGGTQADNFKSHQHYIYGQDNLAPPSGSVSNEVANVENPGSGSAYFSRISSATGDTETRPRNVALLACIKY